ncbi:MAG: VOC family protein [Actinomycetota bacterium]|jgi:catechol 2,3-dioxygenase-like lactoylglutathione lyase family enzyme|nr:VOC family protein [Actinomycetota bacterium]
MSLHFGQPTQLGYVVRDLDAAIDHWSRVLGIGPWYLFDPFVTDEFVHRGEAVEPDVRIALSNSGSMQIELIEQRNDATTMYKEFLDSGREGLQHLAWWPEDYDAALAHAESLGWTVGQQGAVTGGGRFIYYDTEAHPGTVIELAEIGERGRSFFDHIANTAAAWDGVTDPIHRTGA